MDNSDLQARLKEWLMTQGYPLEMRTAQIFHRRGWFFHHSRYYKDPIMGKEREIDLIAFYDDPARTNRIHGHFVIECKWTPKKPWVLFTAARHSLNSIGHFSSTPMTRTAAQAVKDLDPKDILEFPLFSGVEEGYSIVQAFSNSVAVDAAYSAVQSAVSAADYFAHRMSEKTKHRIIYVPTIILDGELFRCSLTNEGGVLVEQADIGFLIHKTTADEMNRGVHIVRESALLKFIDRAEMTFQSLRRILRK
ncbi:MAG TPA: hypothetical protein VE732_01800 [Nitrososphaera sp.]|jgi:hypothetical protein|nr:hypothetical protein [Nitrososphaera sp.]